MKKEELLQFVPENEDKWASTHRIAQRAKQNDIVAYSWLVELKNLPRPLVQCLEFGGKRRKFRLWKKSTIETSKIEMISKIEPQNRSNEEHLLLCRDKYWGDWHRYVMDIYTALKDNR